MMNEEQVASCAAQVRDALTRLGFAYQTKAGDTVEVSFKSLTLAADRYALLEVDTQRLPPRVSVPRLETPDVLTHLSAVIGKPVRRLNTVGLTYVVMLQKPARRIWPRAIALDLASCPEAIDFAWPFGVGSDGQAVWASLSKTGHLLVGGKPGAGKSTFLNAGLVSLLAKHDPEALRLVLIDPKSVELFPYGGIPHLARPVATEAAEAAGAIAWLVEEMNRREALFKAVMVKSLAAYNKQAADPLPLVLTVIDEVTDFVITAGGVKSDPFMNLVRLSSKGRAFGLVLCLATQNPKADILDTLVRENSGVRVAFKVDTLTQSKSILGTGGAEDLPAQTPGRLMTDLGGRGLQMLQGFAVEDAQIAALVGGLKSADLSPLKPLEGELVAFALSELAGAFRLSAVYERFKTRISWRALSKMAKTWEVRGWLSKPASATAPRLVTEELKRLVGVAPQGDEAVTRSQGSSAVTDGEDAGSSMADPAGDRPGPGDV